MTTIEIVSYVVLGLGSGSYVLALINAYSKTEPELRDWAFILLSFIVIAVALMQLATLKLTE